MNLGALGVLSESLVALEDFAGLERGQLQITIRLRLPVSAQLQANHWLPKATILTKRPWWYWKRYPCSPARPAQAFATQLATTVRDED